MGGDERSFWQTEFKDLKDRSDAANTKMIAWAGKFAGLAENTKNEINILTAKVNELNIPWYKTYEFYKDIVKIIFFGIAVYLIYQHGGCIYVKDFVQFGTCK